MIMHLIPLALIVIQLFLIVSVLLLTEQSLIPAEKPAAAASYCEKECGGISIPFPFGIGSNCSFDHRYAIICKTSLSPPKPFLHVANNFLEILEISLKDSTLRVNSPVFSNCPNKARTTPLNLSKSPFAFSSTANKFASVGCANSAFLVDKEENMISGCMSYCVKTNRGNSSSSCHGQECCQTRIPWHLDYVDVYFKNARSCQFQKPKKDSCIYALIAEEKWVDSTLDQNIFAIKELKFVPAVLEWTMYNNGTCAISDDQTINHVSLTAASCAPSNAYCSSRSNNQSFVCFCDEGYEGNPYVECKGN